MYENIFFAFFNIIMSFSLPLDVHQRTALCSAALLLLLTLQTLQLHMQ